MLEEAHEGAVEKVQKGVDGYPLDAGFDVTITLDDRDAYALAMAAKYVMALKEGGVEVLPEAFFERLVIASAQVSMAGMQTLIQRMKETGE